LISLKQYIRIKLRCQFFRRAGRRRKPATVVDHRINQKVESEVRRVSQALLRPTINPTYVLKLRISFKNSQRTPEGGGWWMGIVVLDCVGVPLLFATCF